MQGQAACCHALPLAINNGCCCCCCCRLYCLQWLGAGGLTAFLQQDAATGQPLPDALFWDLSDPAHPKYSHGLYTPGGACTDE